MKEKINKFLTVIAPFVVFGSGVINILSASGKPLPDRQQFLLNIFPIEFLELSNLLTLGLGLLLGITAFNLYKKKKRAFILSSIFLSFSVIFHLTKGFDFEEAFFSFLTLLILLKNRRLYTVLSEKVDVREIVFNITISILFLLLYGVAGFWLLDKKDFGLKFSIADSIRRTLREIFFYSDGLIPKTHYAKYFLDSLNMATVVILFSFFSSIFAPIAFSFSEILTEKKRAKVLTESYGFSSIDFFKTWGRKSYFFNNENNAFISYAVNSGTVIALGDPLGESSSISNIISDFVDYCQNKSWRYGFVATTDKNLEIYHNLGLNKFKIGDEAIVDLTAFSTSGSKGKDSRNIVNKFIREKYSTELLHPPIPYRILNRLKVISDEWLTIPGRKEHGFAQGYFSPSYITNASCFVVKNSTSQIIAFVNLITSYHPKEATIDLMRHIKNPPNGIMDYLFIKLFLLYKEKGYERFSLGLAALSGFKTGEKSSRTERLVHNFAQRTDFLISFKGLKFFKSKYATFWEPRYLIYKSQTDLPFLANALNNLTKT
jgi:phosphatidylglycerol lysyltransferase